jgi:REP element-mobilizing transposase RayT
MAKPPRISCWLPLEVPEFYLLTLCQKDRLPLLANQAFASVFEAVLGMATHWEHEAWVIMPDHIHILAGPKSRAYGVSDWSRFVKVRSQRLFPSITGWQRGVFDHLLRSSDLGQGRWDYLRNNPVRAGLVDNWWEWPFFGGNLKNRPCWSRRSATLQNIQLSWLHSASLCRGQNWDQILLS